MNFSMKKLLKDKRVLYFVLFLALTNLFHFLFSRDFNGLTLFLVLGLLMSYFTKNMIVVLVVTMLVTHLFRRNLREGLEGKEVPKMARLALEYARIHRHVDGNFEKMVENKDNC